MSRQFAIDAFAFAREGGDLDGLLKISDLERLHDLLVDATGEVRFRVTGSTGELDQAQLRVQVSGRMPLACQRCLQPVDFDLAVDSLLEPVPEGVELAQDELEDDRRDFLPVSGLLELATLIEDEILLALPLCPRHETCGLPGTSEAGERMTPFAALSVLKGKPN